MAKDKRTRMTRKGYNLRARYGIDIKMYNYMVELQGGKCGICHEEHEKLFVDHEHGSGLVRGLLCKRCNTGLSMFKDSPERVHNALRYLHIHGRTI